MILLCLLLIGHPEPSLARVRGLYEQCVVSEDSCKALIDLLKDCDDLHDPVLAAYRAGAFMVMAKYELSPWTKWRCFCRGRDLLERSVAADGRNVEVIFVRYAVQRNCPWCLNYRHSLEHDKAFIEANLEQVTDPALKQKIKYFLGSFKG